MARLTGQQIGQLQDALLDAFNQQELEDLLVVLEHPLDRIVSPADSLPTMIRKVVQDAERKGWTADLLRAVATERRDLPEFQALLSALLAQLESPSSGPPNRGAPPVAGAGALLDLRDVLVAAYDDLPRAREITARVGIVSGTLPSSTLPMRDWWWEAIQALQRQGKLLALVDAAIADPTVAALKPRFEALRDNWT